MDVLASGEVCDGVCAVAAGEGATFDDLRFAVDGAPFALGGAFAFGDLGTCAGEETIALGVGAFGGVDAAAAGEGLCIAPGVMAEPGCF